jgi:hypothetical protein
MFVVIHTAIGEEFARNNIDRLEFTDSDDHQVDQFFTDEEVTETMVIVNLNQVVAVGLSPNLSEVEYKRLAAFEKEANLKLNTYESSIGVSEDL